MKTKWTLLLAGGLSGLVLTAVMARSADLQPRVVKSLTGDLHIDQDVPCGDNVVVTTPVTQGRLELSPAEGFDDPAVTGRLRSLAAADPNVLDEIYQSFLSSTEEHLDALRKAAQAGDPDALAKAAHALKGASGNIGASDMWEFCRQLELLGNARSVAGADEPTQADHPARASGLPSRLSSAGNFRSRLAANSSCTSSPHLRNSTRRPKRTNS